MQYGVDSVVVRLARVFGADNKKDSKAMSQFMEKAVLRKSGATVFSCIIKIQQLRALFFLDENHNGIHLIDDQYSIALQKIIENFTHYLSVNDGYGDVIYGSSNDRRW
ncbi:hypothetical protein [Anaerobutyricum hallii]|uniref:hypothetical protein n=1 Tax=Anaerobutyricum hallii TaxID=39488 RepID=UPI0026769FE9|nr:hypothetical protein [Anaerobutyricum hallii]